MSGTRSSSRIKALHGQKTVQQDTPPTVATTGARPSGGRSKKSVTTTTVKSDSKGKYKIPATKSVNTPVSKTAKAPASKAKPPANKRRKVAKANETADDDAIEEDQTKVKKPRKRKGKLQQITDMPLDILFEIFKLVDPVDLLHLAHANKTLRSTLLQKNCKWIWEYSVKHYRTPIPPCMDDRLPLPQYINLLFTQNCFAHAIYRYVVKEYLTWYKGVRPHYRLPGCKSRTPGPIANRQEIKAIEEELGFIKDEDARRKREEEIDENSERIMEVQGNKKKQDLRRIRTQRYNFLIKMLGEMAYEEESLKLRSWNKAYLDKYLDRDTELTARGWASMARSFKEYIDELILLRKKAVAIKTFRARIVVLRGRLEKYHTLAPQFYQPSFPEFAVREPLI
ncbi:hypothetical protein EV121DRAFT_269733 [Schizophyllum commune]